MPIILWLLWTVRVPGDALFLWKPLYVCRMLNIPFIVIVAAVLSVLCKSVFDCCSVTAGCLLSAGNLADADAHANKEHLLSIGNPAG
eukprot:scaffold71688_cov19-Tisochrysis_lutea.AAC.2